MYLVKTPLLLQWLYPTLTWKKSRAQKIIYLTFDDGPIPDVTDFVLKSLAAYHAKATFFCIGANITKHPIIFNNLKTAGHSIGNHTFSHLKGWQTNDEIYQQNFNQCQQLTQTNLFRPPYGRIKRSQILKLKAQNLKLNTATTNKHSQLQIIMWDVLSGDFDTKLSPEKCYQNVINNAKNGSIVVFHDSLKAFDRLQFVLPKVLAYFTKKGYKFLAL